MRVIVFGATGRTGRHVLRLALDRGHEVTAFGRSADRLDPEPGVSAFKGDVLDPGAVAAAVEGHDGVIVCLGSTGLRDSTCGCPKSCRGWSGGMFVFVDQAVAAGRSDGAKGRRVVSRVVVGGGVSGWPLV